MTQTTRPRRSSFLQAADVLPLSRRQRWLRLKFREEPAIPDEKLQAFDALVEPTHVFTPTPEGSGIFGKWTVDQAGLPAYDYELDQYADARAKFDNSEGLDRRDHWHQIGNRWVTALASNDGTVQVYLGDRGGVFLNKFEALQTDRPAAGIISFLAQIVLAIIRLVARIQMPKAPDTAQPFAAQSAATQSIRMETAKNPRDTLGIEWLRGLREEVNDPLLKSYNLLSTQDEPVVKAEAVTPTATSQSASKIAATAYAYAGGFGYIDDGEQVWATAFRCRPSGAAVKRRFGISYMETEMDYRRRLLEEAMLLGNGEKHKVKMIFETTQGAIMVNTTVWD
ncbi:MAG: hypothetical protein ABI970_09340, partial [Chloroflexota bacterium]